MIYKMFKLSILLLVVAVSTLEVSGVNTKLDESAHEPSKEPSFKSSNEVCTLPVSFDSGISYSNFFHNCWYEPGTALSKCFSASGSFTFTYEYEGAANTDCYQSSSNYFYTGTWIALFSSDINDGVGGFSTPVPSMSTKAYLNERSFTVYLVCDGSYGNLYVSYSSTWCSAYCMIIYMAPSDAPELCAAVGTISTSPSGVPSGTPTTAAPMNYPPSDCPLLVETEGGSSTYYHKCWYKTSSTVAQCFKTYPEYYDVTFTYDLEGSRNRDCDDQISGFASSWSLVTLPDENNNVGGFSTPYPSLKTQVTGPNSVDMYLTCSPTTPEHAAVYYSTWCSAKSCIVLSIASEDAPDLCALLDTYTAMPTTATPTGVPSAFIPPTVSPTRPTVSPSVFKYPTGVPSFIPTKSSLPTGVPSAALYVPPERPECPLLVSQGSESTSFNHTCWYERNSTVSKCFDASGSFSFTYYLEGDPNPNCYTSSSNYFSGSWTAIFSPDGNDGSNGFVTPVPSLKTSATLNSGSSFSVYLACHQTLRGVAFKGGWCSAYCLIIYIKPSNAQKLCDFLGVVTSRPSSTGRPSTAIPTGVPSGTPTTAAPMYYPPSDCPLLVETEGGSSTYYHKCWYKTSSTVAQCFTTYPEYYDVTFTYDLEGSRNRDCDDQISGFASSWSLVTLPDENNNVGGFSTPYPSLKTQVTGPNSVDMYLTCSPTTPEHAAVYYSTWCSAKSCIVLSIASEDAPDLCALLDTYTAMPTTATPTGVPSAFIAPTRKPSSSPTIYVNPTGVPSATPSYSLNDYECPLSVSFDSGSSYTNYYHECWYKYGTTVSKCFDASGSFSFTYYLEGDTNPYCYTSYRNEFSGSWTAVFSPDGNDGAGGFETPVPSIKTDASLDDKIFTVYLVCQATTPSEEVSYSSSWCSAYCMIMYVKSTKAPDLCATLTGSGAPSLRSNTPSISSTSPPVYQPVNFPSSNQPSPSTNQPVVFPSSNQPVAPTSTPSSIFNDILACFAASELVEIDDGHSVPISSIKVGDRVLSASADGKLVYADVIAVPHAKNDIRATFISLSVASNEITLTSDHLILAGPCGESATLIRAADVTIGSCIVTTEGPAEVIETARKESKGVYTIVTTEEFIVVNGIIASPFAANHVVAHSFYSMHRFLFKFIPFIMKSAIVASAVDVINRFSFFRGIFM